MPFKKNTFFDTSRITVLFAFAAILIGIMALAGWIFDIEFLRSFKAEWGNMEVNTAFGIICASISLLLFLSVKKSRLAFLLGLVVLLLGLVSFSEYFFKWDGNIDHLFFQDKSTPSNLFPGRIAPLASAGFVALGVLLLLFQNKKRQRIIDIGSIILLTVSALTTITYLFSAKSSYTIFYINTISFPATLAFLFISLAIFFSRPERGLIAAFNENTKAARFGTRQIIFLILILLVLAWLCLKGYNAEYYDMQFGISIMVVAFAVIFFFAAKVVIRKLNLIENERKEMYKELEESETNLRQVMDNSSGMIASIDRGHRVIVFNKALAYEYKRFCGKDLKPGDIHYKVFPPEGQMVWKSKIDEALSGITVHFERNYEVEEKKIYAEVFLYPIRKGSCIEGVTCFVTNITKRKLAELEREENQQKYHSLFENSADGILLTIPDGAVLAANKAACEIFGMTEEEICNAGRTGLVDMTDPNLPILLQQRRLTGRTSGELTFKRKDGTKFSGEITSVIFKDASGNERTSMIIRDISKRKEAEQLVKISEARLKKAQQIAHIGSWYYNFKENKAHWSEETYRIFGVSPESYTPLPETMGELVHPDDRKVFVEYVNSLLSGRNLGELQFRILLPDHSIRYVISRGDLKLNADGKPSSITGTVQDITSMKKAEQVIKESEEKFRTLVQQAAEGIFVVDLEGNYLEANESAASLTGYSIEELKKMNAREIAEPEDLKNNPIRTEEIKAGKSVVVERVIRRKDKTLVKVEISAKLMDNGTVISIMRDITERKKAEQLLRESEKKLREITASIPGVVYQYKIGPGGKMEFTFLSDGIFRDQDDTPEDIYKDSSLLLSRVHPDDIGRLMAAIESSNNKMDILNIQYRVKAKDGIYKWMRSDSIPMKMEDGTIVRNGSLLDITATKEAEQKLQESEIKFKNLVENIHESLIVEDIEGRLIYANNEFSKIFGFSEDEFKYLTIRDYTTPEFYEEIITRHNNRMKGIEVPREFEYKGLRKDGREVWIECRVSVLTENGKIIGTQSLERDITKRKLAEEKLKESEERYRSLIEQAEDFILIVDSKGNILDVNSSLCNSLGYKKDELLGQFVSILVDPEDLKTTPIRLDRIKQGESLITERRWIDKKGNIIEVEANSKMLFDGRIMAIVRDVRDRKKAEQALKESESKYRTIVETTDEMMHRLSQEGKILWVNESWKRNMVLTDQEVIGKKLTDFLDKATKVEFGKVFPQLAKGKKTGNLSCGFITKKGEVIYLEGQVLPVIINGKFAGSQAFFRNVTERKKAEDKIREQENRYRALVDSAPDATVIVNEKGIIQMANLQAVKLLGYTKAELAGMAVEMLIPPSHQSKHKGYRLRYIKNPHTRSMGTGRDLVAVRKDGLEVPVEISLATYQFAGGNLITASLRDITERKKTEKELEKSYHSVRQLTEYLQNVREEERTYIAREIHDELGQQLTVMMMDVSWLSRKVGAENEAATKKINELLNLLEGTVKTVRRISTELRPSVLDDLGVAATMELHLREFEKRSGIQTCFVRSKKELKLTGPVKNALFRIFQESLTNVARHSGAEKVIVKLESTNNKVILMIEDNGVGFDEKKASEKRTLGVLGMKERAAGIGGEYIISGKPGKGTTIFVTVPLPE